MMSTKCMFICPTKYNYNFVKPERVKYAVLTMMSHVADLTDPFVIDLEMMLGYPRNLKEISEFRTNAKNILKNYLPDIVCITCYTSFDYLSTVDILRMCKELYPNATLVVGGYHATAVPEDFLDDEIPVDFIIRGEGEIALRNIITQNGRDLPKVIMGTPLNMTEEKPLRYDLYPYKTDELYISLSRGCFHRCAFCVQSDDFPNPYRKMDIDNIKDKIVRATEYFPIKRLLFSDPIFGIDMKGTEQLVEFLSNKYPHYTYWAETRIDRTTEDLIKCLSKLKIDLHFGVESLAEDTLLNLMTKTKNAEQYNEAFFKTIEYCQKYDVLGLFGFIMNYPGEKAESSRYTMQQLKKVTSLYDKLNVTFHINPYALYPGNEIYNRRFELAESRGFKFENDYWWKSDEPDIRQRSENCLASSSIEKSYSEGRFYWHKTKNELLRKYVSMYNYKAYKFYQRAEVKDVIYSIKGEAAEIKEWEIDLISHYRYITSNYLERYNTWLNEKKPLWNDVFYKAYLFITYNAQRKILSSYKENIEIRVFIADVEKTLETEYKKNIELNRGEGDSLKIRFLDEKYQLYQNGKLKHIQVKDE